jgi:hypothetical protein
LKIQPGKIPFDEIEVIKTADCDPVAKNCKVLLRVYADSANVLGKIDINSPLYSDQRYHKINAEVTDITGDCVLEGLKCRDSCNDLAKTFTRSTSNSEKIFLKGPIWYFDKDQCSVSGFKFDEGGEVEFKFDDEGMYFNPFNLEAKTHTFVVVPKKKDSSLDDK